MKTTKAILTVLIALFAVTANAQTATEVVNKYKGQDGVKTEDFMPDVKRMVEMFKNMPAQGGGQGGPGMPDMSALSKALEGIKTYTSLTLPADKVAAVKADLEALKDYKSLIEYTEDGGQGGGMGMGMPQPKVGADGIRRLQLPSMFQQAGGMQAYAKVTDNKFNEVMFFTSGQNNALSIVEATDLTVDNIMMIMMIPMMRNMQQGGGFGGGGF